MISDSEFNRLELIYNKIEYNGNHKKINNKCKCNEDLLINDFYTVCPSCGIIHNEILFDNTYEMIKVDKTYQRIYHVQEQISNIQGHIPCPISDELKNVIVYLTGNNPYQLKKVLRKLKLKKHYEKMPFIKWYIWKIQPPIINDNLKKRIITMYKQIENIYYSMNLNRKRFLLIHFIIYKILLNLNEFKIASHIEKKSFKNDEIWITIKEKLNLKY